MNVEQERKAFKAWLGITPCGSAHDFAWEAWRARAALQSQDREDALIVAMQEAVDLLGPSAPSCCGCEYEWNHALRALRAAIDHARYGQPAAPVTASTDTKQLIYDLAQEAGAARYPSLSETKIDSLCFDPASFERFCERLLEMETT